MRTRTLFALLVILLAAEISFAQQSETQLAYINRYKDIAIREMERAGIPASIKLAQGILESNSGQSTLARRANNHFGIKCGANWEGGTIYREDDDYDANGKLIKSCFRSYKNSQASYIAHSEFLRDPRKAFRYGFLFRLDPQDYRRWAHGLKQAGYATSPTYPEKLITIIERYELFRYDDASSVDIDTPADIVASGILDNNDVRYVVANEGETLEDIAKRVNVSVRNLIDYNEELTGAQQKVDQGEWVYLQPKRNSYRGRDQYHTVLAGETMYDISQRYAIKLSKLFKRNLLRSGQEPAAGEQVKVRGCKVKDRPKLQEEVVEETPPANVPVTEDGEIDFENPVEEETEPSPTRPTTTAPSSSPVIVQPETPSSGGDQPEVPIIIINPGSQPAPTPSPTTEQPQNPAPAPSTTQPQNPTPAPSTNNPPPVINPGAPSNPNPTPPPSTGDSPVYHTVVAGETLYGISRRYNTTVEQLKVLNGLSNNTIQVGSQLRVQ
ncbi:MAG: glucosaminidase domain-containing protein [Bacteroidota bacterium]